MKASIIVSHLNSVNTLVKCMSCLMAQDYPRNEYEILSIDGADYNNCSEAIGQIIGLHQAKGDVVLITNSDVFVKPNWLSSHLKYYPQTDMVLGAAPHSTVYSLFGLSFTNFSIKRCVLDIMGINDTFHQDLDLALRLFKEYKRFNYVIDNSITVDTYDNGITGKKAFMYLTNMIILYKKYRMFPLPPQLGSIKNGIDRPEKLLGILTGLLTPTSHTLNKRVKHL